MKTVIIGDTHGRTLWKSIVEVENPDRVIFVGDYFDTHEDVSGAGQMMVFQEIIDYKKSQDPGKIIMLIGNHDHHYFPEVGYTGTSGYQSGAAVAIGFLISENKEHLQMAYQFDNILCTHAGVGKTFLEAQGWKDGEDISGFLNDLWKYKPKAFCFTGFNPYGDDMGQTPIWIRPKSLMKDAQDFKKDVIQVVGHTSQNKIDIKGKSTGGRYFFIDTLGTSGEYLIIEGDNITCKS